MSRSAGAFVLRRLAYSLILTRLFALIITAAPFTPLPLAFTAPTLRLATAAPTDERVLPFRAPPTALEVSVAPVVALCEDECDAARCAPSFAITFEREIRGLRWTLGFRPIVLLMDPVALALPKPEPEPSDPKLCSILGKTLAVFARIGDGMPVIGLTVWPVLAASFAAGLVGRTNGELKILLSPSAPLPTALRFFFLGDSGRITGIFDGESADEWRELVLGSAFLFKTEDRLARFAFVFAKELAVGAYSVELGRIRGFVPILPTPLGAPVPEDRLDAVLVRVPMELGGPIEPAEPLMLEFRVLVLPNIGACD